LKTIGVFDSGVGGLSVLQALLAEMPSAQFVYAADSGHAPYGERTAEQVSHRTHRITRHLRETHALDALVIACNTATAHAIDSLRLEHPDLPIVGVEPALKPAATITRSGHIGVLATRGTLSSARVLGLRDRLRASSDRPLQFSFQPCDGLANAIERHDTQAIETLCTRFVNELLTNAKDGPQIDTLVLGCTHYPFASELIRRISGPQVTVVDTGAAVARRTREVLGVPQGTPDSHACEAALPILLASAQPHSLSEAVHRWLNLHVPAQLLPF
jgi:glutamate racemase